MTATVDAVAGRVYPLIRGAADVWRTAVLVTRHLPRLRRGPASCSRDVLPLRCRPAGPGEFNLLMTAPIPTRVWAISAESPAMMTPGAREARDVVCAGQVISDHFVDVG